MPFPTRRLKAGRKYRIVSIVSEEPQKRGGKARLWAFGLRAIAKAAGVSEKTVRRAAGTEFDPAALAEVSRYVSTKRL